MNEKDIARILKRKKVDLLVFGEDERVRERVQAIAFQFRFVKESFAEAEAYAAKIYDFSKPALMLIERTSDIARLHELAPRACLVLLTEKSLSAEEMARCRERGLDVSLSRQEFFQTPKFEFLCLQKTRAQYFPISLQDIFPSTEMSFHASVRLPLNQKYLPVLFKGFLLTEEKYRKIEKEGRLFIKSQDASEYLGYIETYNDGLGVGLKKRCRALFLCLSHQLLSLYEHLVFDGMTDQPERGFQLWADLQTHFQQLTDYFQNADGVDLWEVFKDALYNEIFNHWRAPWHVVYAGLACQRVAKGDPLTAMKIAALADLGLMDIPPDVFFEFVHRGEAELPEDSRKELRKHPILSLNRCLSRGLELGEEVKTGIVLTHERQDGKGYPNQSPAEQIPFEVWAVQYAEIIDLGVRLSQADASVPFKFVRKITWEKRVAEEGAFPEHVSKLLSLCHEEKSS